MKLYEIEQAILECFDLESGEIIDLNRLEELQIEKEKKIENMALYIKNLKAEAAALKAEKESFAEREKRAKAKIDGITKWLSEILSGEKFSSTKVSITFRKSESVNIIDEELLPAEFIHFKTDKVADKGAIKEAIKNNISVPGAELVQKNNIQIK